MRKSRKRVSHHLSWGHLTRRTWEMMIMKSRLKMRCRPSPSLHCILCCLPTGRPLSVSSGVCGAEQWDRVVRLLYREKQVLYVFWLCRVVLRVNDST